MSITSSLIVIAIMIIGLTTHVQKNCGHPVQWEMAGQLPGKSAKPSLGFAGPVTGVNGNMLVIAGGANFPDAMPWEGGKKKYHDSVFIYKKNADQLILVSRKQKLPFPLAYAASCSTPMGILFAGGENESGLSRIVKLMYFEKNHTSINYLDLPDLPIALTNASATCLNDIIYLAGGETKDGTSNAFFQLDLNNTNIGWKTLPPVPAPVSHMVMTSTKHNGRDFIFLAGGRRKNKDGISTFYSSLYRYDTGLQQWKSLSDMPYTLSAGTGIAIQACILIFGGDRGKTFHETELLLRDINKENDSLKRSALIHRKNELQSSHPGFSKEILSYNIETEKWKSAGCMPFETPVTTTAVIWDDLVILPTGEIKAGVRTAAIIKGKLCQADSKNDQ